MTSLWTSLNYSCSSTLPGQRAASCVEDYQGGRGFEDLKKFVDDLLPQCEPGHLELCDDEQKAQIARFSKLSDNEREELIKQQEDEMPTKSVWPSKNATPTKQMASVRAP